MEPRNIGAKSTERWKVELSKVCLKFWLDSTTVTGLHRAVKSHPSFNQRHLFSSCSQTAHTRLLAAEVLLGSKLGRVGSHSWYALIAALFRALELWDFCAAALPCYKSYLSLCCPLKRLLQKWFVLIFDLFLSKACFSLKSAASKLPWSDRWFSAPSTKSSLATDEAQAQNGFENVEEKHLWFAKGEWPMADFSVS